MTINNKCAAHFTCFLILIAKIMTKTLSLRPQFTVQVQLLGLQLRLNIESIPAVTQPKSGKSVSKINYIRFNKQF